MVVFVDSVVLRSNGFRYVPRLLSGDVVLVEVLSGLGKTITMGWEVWKLRPYAPNYRGFCNRWRVRFPANSDFGRYGWFFSGRDDAESKFKSLLEGGV